MCLSSERKRHKEARRRGQVLGGDFKVLKNKEAK